MKRGWCLKGKKEKKKQTCEVDDDDDDDLGMNEVLTLTLKIFAAGGGGFTTEFCCEITERTDAFVGGWYAEGGGGL